MGSTAKLVLSFLLGCIFCGYSGYSQDTLVHNRPRIGLVLSGGGAKGLAHIGVLKVLEELNLPVDYITGTSMGSIIGGLYACGYSAAQIEEICHHINWNDILFDKISRRNIAIETKTEDGKYVAEFPVVHGKLILPRGIVSGQNVSMLLSHLTWAYHNISDFSKLPVPFRCIATDIENIEPVVLKNGFLPDAIRASMGIPSVFVPLEIDNHLLVDGGVMRNFPVQDAKEMGADIIIGVNVSQGLYNRKQLISALQIMDQATTFQIVKSNLEQRKLCNYLIEPDISLYNLFSFEDLDSLINVGEKAARAMYPRLKALADSMARYALPKRKSIHLPSRNDSIYISAIQYEGLEKVSKNLVIGNLQLKAPSWITLQELERGIERIYGSRFFEIVNYKLVSGDHGLILVIRLKEQTSNFFKFSLNYDDALRSAILLNYTSLNVLGQGSRLQIDLRLGESPALVTKYSIHTAIRPNVGFGVLTGFNKFETNFFNNKGQLRSNYNLQHFRSELEFRSSLSNYFLFTAGIEGEYMAVKPVISINDTSNLDISALSSYARFFFDTNDRAIFPKKGDQFFGEIKLVVDEKNAAPYNWKTSFWRLLIAYQKTVLITPRISILSMLNGGAVSSDRVHYAFQFYLGGQHSYEPNIFPFTGMQFMEASGSNLIAYQLGLRFEPWVDKFISIRGNVATTALKYDELIKFKDNYWGFGVAAGVKTLLGPVEVSLNRSNISRQLISQIKIGYFF